MGYHFSDERIARIAENSLRLGKNGYATLMSTAIAFDWDLLIWGDPKARPLRISGILKTTLDEIYGENYGQTKKS